MRGPQWRSRCAHLTDVSDVFLAGLSVCCFVVAAVAVAGSLFARRFLPARAAVPAPQPLPN
jgi:hypothetical protein